MTVVRPRRRPLLPWLMLLVAVLASGAAVGCASVDVAPVATTVTAQSDSGLLATDAGIADAPGGSCPTEHDPLQNAIGRDALRAATGVGAETTPAPPAAVPVSCVPDPSSTDVSAAAVAAPSGVQLCALLCISRR